MQSKKDTRKRTMEDERPALTKHFIRVADWFEVALLAAMAPLFVFPKPGWTWLFLVFPLIWIMRWSEGTEKEGVKRARTVIDVALLILCIQLLISSLISGEIQTSLPKITGILYGILVFYGLVRLLRTEILIRVGIGLFIMGSTALATIGLVGMSKWTEGGFSKPVHYILEKIPQKNWGFQGAELGLHPNALAGVMILFVPLSTVLAAWGMKKKARKHLVSQRIDLLFFSILTLYFSLILYLSLSMASWMALVVSLWFILPSWKAKAAWIAPAMVFVIIVLVVIPAKYNRVVAKEEKPFWMNKIEGRYMYWIEGLVAIGERPVTGIGVNQLRMRARFKYEDSHAHNHMIHTAAELGIPGLVAYLAILMGAGYMCIETWRKAPDGWMRTAAQGLGAGQLAHFIFGLGDSIPLGAKPGIFFWVSLALIAVMYNFTIKQKLIEKETEL